MNPRALAAGMSLFASLALTISPLVPLQAIAAKPSAEHHLPSVSEEVVGKKTFQVSRTVVKAKPERVWHILTDYNNAPAIFENLKKCELMEDHGTMKVVKHVVHPSGWPGTFEYVLEIKETAPHAMEWHRIRGAFREVDGFWKLEPIEGGHATQVTYSAYVNGGLFFPAPIIKAQLRDDMPEVMAALKSSAESTPTEIAARGNHSHND